MAREIELVNALLRLAAGLVTEADPDELLERLVRETLDLLDVESAGVMIESEEGTLTAVAASSRHMKQLEILELATQEGPSYDAYATGQPVVALDLDTADERWPVFAERARALSFSAVYGFPLRLEGTVIGAINLFQTAEQAPLGDADQRAAQGFADMATLALLQHREVSSHRSTSEQLQHALDSRVVIEQAKGLLAGRHSISPDEAFDVLRDICRRHNLKLRSAAEEIVSGRL